MISIGPRRFFWSKIESKATFPGTTQVIQLGWPPRVLVLRDKGLPPAGLMNRTKAVYLALRHIRLAAFFLRQAIAADPEHLRKGTLTRVAQALDIRYRRIREIV